MLIPGFVPCFLYVFSYVLNIGMNSNATGHFPMIRVSENCRDWQLLLRCELVYILPFSSFSSLSASSFALEPAGSFSAQRNTTPAFTDYPYRLPNVEYIITSLFFSSPFGLAFQF